MSPFCIKDPFGTVKVVSRIAAQIEEFDCSISVSTDIDELDATRLALRGGHVAPFLLRNCASCPYE